MSGLMVNKLYGIIAKEEIELEEIDDFMNEVLTEQVNNEEDE